MSNFIALKSNQTNQIFLTIPSKPQYFIQKVVLASIFILTNKNSFFNSISFNSINWENISAKAMKFRILSSFACLEIDFPNKYSEQFINVFFKYTFKIAFLHWWNYLMNCFEILNLNLIYFSILTNKFPWQVGINLN